MLRFFALPLLSLAVLCGGAAAQNCDSLKTELWAGQYKHRGNVVITNSLDEIAVHIKTAPLWFITEVHIYAGAGPLPTNSGGNVAPGQFPYQTSYDPGVLHHTEVIPVAATGLACGDTALMAVHVVLEKFINGVFIREETAWAVGNPFSGSQWGWSMDYPICCDGCGPTGGFLLDADPLQAGMPADLTASGAAAGAVVHFAANGGEVTCGSGYYVGAAMDSLDLAWPITRLGSAVADANGNAVLGINMPPSAAVGRLYGFQAAYLDAGGLAKSNALFGVVQP
jgi:hypothetical protein